MNEEKENPSEEETEPKRRRIGLWAVFRSVAGTVASLLVVGVAAAGLLAIYHPDTPLPREWNPTEPLVVSDPATPLTQWKLRAALGDPQQCLAVLTEAASIRAEDPFEASENCHIRNRVRLMSLAGAEIDDVETACNTALRVAMWERHGIQPAAREIFGTDVTVIRQIGSYNCRPIRTTQGPSTRWSTHSTADAIDITGFDLADGQTIRLISDWDGADDKARFLRAVRDSACDWFATTLGPDFNSLHADHFHLQSRGWGTCR